MGSNHRPLSYQDSVLPLNYTLGLKNITKLSILSKQKTAPRGDSLHNKLKNYLREISTLGVHLHFHRGFHHRIRHCLRRNHRLSLLFEVDELPLGELR